MDLSVRARMVETHAVVEVRGEVDLHSAAQLRNRLAEVIDTGKPIVLVDLTQLSFIDSTGLGALVAGRNHAVAAEVNLRLICHSERMLKLFRITGLITVFDIYATVPEALSAAGLP